MEPKSVRRELLERAIQLVDNDRNRDYGAPGGDFKTIAAFWQIYLTRTIEKRGKLDVQGHDVALMQNLSKTSRLAWTPEKQDSWDDTAGYASCGYECVVGEAETETASAFCPAGTCDLCDTRFNSAKHPQGTL